MKNFLDHPHVDNFILKLYPNFKKVINDATHIEEKLVITWAADVLSALSCKDNLKIVYYEHFVEKPNDSFLEILDLWDFDNLEISEKLLSRKSSSSKEWSNIGKKIIRMAYFFE